MTFEQDNSLEWKAGLYRIVKTVGTFSSSYDCYRGKAFISGGLTDFRQARKECELMETVIQAKGEVA